MAIKSNYFDVANSGRFNFVGKTKIFVIFSIVAMLATLAVVGIKGLNYGVDFTGGTEVQVEFSQDVDTSQVRTFTESLNLGEVHIQKFDEGNEFLLRFQTEENPAVEAGTAPGEALAQTIAAVTNGIKTTFATQGPAIKRVDSVGPQVGSQLKNNAVLAIFYSLLLILVYIGLRFDYVYAPGAVLCLFHDALVTVGVLALLQKEINVQILAALLTIIGYSLNDTIVIFDRIRENKGLFPDKNFPWLINLSMNEMLSRTITTSATTLIAVLSLYIFADGVIRDFAFAMSIGIVAGAYSTIYIATPMVIFCDILQKRKKTA